MTDTDRLAALLRAIFPDHLVSDAVMNGGCAEFDRTIGFHMLAHIDREKGEALDRGHKEGWSACEDKYAPMLAAARDAALEEAAEHLVTGIAFQSDPRCDHYFRWAAGIIRALKSAKEGR